MRRAFTLPELMLAVGLLALVLLTLVGLTTATVRSNHKAALLGPAAAVAESLLDRTLSDVAADIPPGTRDSFWAASGPGPWKSLSPLDQGGVRYEYAIYAHTVADVTGTPVGGASNRVKKVDLVLCWWGSAATAGDRNGYGRMQLSASRLVNEGAAP
ncbi:MAG: prepilin-type N-terminal cleavage/methylation domain-containing protein [Candidatus Eremiobacterota bacterium]